ncbi:MAG: hypothetical protein JXX28_06135 [Deltaproteobacteria bacterium]|nr:hypothetical protein [Deltaproteobacteria bacterium]
MIPTLLLSLLLGCDPVQTPGQAVEVQLLLGGADADGLPPSQQLTSAGWEVRLDQAQIVLGPIYLYDGEPMASRTPVQRALGVVMPSAQACATHAQHSYGEVLSELREQHLVDLLAPTPLDAGWHGGLAGEIRSAEVQLHPPGTVALAATYEALAPLEGHTLWLAGEARRDQQVRPFEVKMDLPDDASWRIVESIAVDGVPLDGQSALLIQARVDLWLDAVDFDQVGADGQIVEDSQPWNALQLGVRSRYAWQVSEVSP